MDIALAPCAAGSHVPAATHTGRQGVGGWHLPCSSGLSRHRSVQALKVLLADFHPQRASALEESLAAQGLEVRRLGPAEMLADAVRSDAPDLVIVDMELPDRDGLA